MFNKSQIQAISHMDGPAMVLAGPGSGKTTVITHRIKNLIEKAEVRPENILVGSGYKYAEEMFYINEWREGTTGYLWHFS